jgi:hypothetical protein
MEINCANERSSGVEWRMGGRSRRTKEGVSDVTGNKNALDAQIDPCRGQIRQRNAPVLLALVDVGFEGETIDPIDETEVTLVVLAIMFVGDP